MSKNRVQFQRSISLVDFMARYSSEQQCQQALFAWRWPSGFVCPRCEHDAYWALGARRLLQCQRCRHQSSLTSDTIFAGSKLALQVWFLAMFLLTQAKNGLSALELSRQLGISYNSTWLMKHKLMQVMKERGARHALGGLVQLDDAYWGGKRPGKGGRGARGKSPLVAAVETDEQGRPRRMRLSRVRGFRLREISRWSKAHLRPETEVYSDGLWCFAAVSDNGCTHHPMPMNRPDVARRRRALKWVDTMLGNVKNAIHGTYHAIGHKHLPRYLAEFCWRFDRRFDLANLLARLAVAATRTPPMPYRLVKLAERHW
jgi:ISXO2-like transposase domain/Transposase zinc-ribbon domain